MIVTNILYIYIVYTVMLLYNDCSLNFPANLPKTVSPSREIVSPWSWNIATRDIPSGGRNFLTLGKTGEIQGAIIVQYDTAVITSKTKIVLIYKLFNSWLWVLKLLIKWPTYKKYFLKDIYYRCMILYNYCSLNLPSFSQSEKVSPSRWNIATKVKLLVANSYAHEFKRVNL